MLHLQELSSQKDVSWRQIQKSCLHFISLHFFPIVSSYDLLLLLCLQHPWFCMLQVYILCVVSWCCGLWLQGGERAVWVSVACVTTEPAHICKPRSPAGSIRETSLCCTCCLLPLVNVPIPLPFHPPLKDTSTGTLKGSRKQQKYFLLSIFCIKACSWLDRSWNVVNIYTNVMVRMKCSL